MGPLFGNGAGGLKGVYGIKPPKCCKIFAPCTKMKLILAKA
jgi:hypothetical protein